MSDKYKTLGPYHFRALLPWPRKDLQSYARYKAVELIFKGMIDHNDLSRILDVGCGEATLEYFLLQRGVRGYFVCMDVSPIALKFAKHYSKKEPHIEFLLGDAHNPPFRRGCFDLIIALEVVEHLRNPLMFLDQIRRCIKKYGTLIMSTSNAAHKGPKDPYHHIEFTPKTLRSVISRYLGFCVVLGLGSLRLFNLRIASLLKGNSRITRIIATLVLKIIDLIELVITCRRLSKNADKSANLVCICKVVM